MSFGSRSRKEIRERSGYFCQICGEWHPPHRDNKTELAAHSLDRTHKDGGMTVCRSGVAGECHTKLHQITEDGKALERLSRTAADLNSLSTAVNLLNAGVPERRVRRVLGRIGNF